MQPSDDFLGTSTPTHTLHQVISISHMTGWGKVSCWIHLKPVVESPIHFVHTLAYVMTHMIKVGQLTTTTGV